MCSAEAGPTEVDPPNLIPVSQNRTVGIEPRGATKPAIPRLPPKAKGNDFSGCVVGHRPNVLVIKGEQRDVCRVLMGEESLFGFGVALEVAVPIEMVRTQVEDDGDVGLKALGRLELKRRDFEDSKVERRTDQ